MARGPRGGKDPKRRLGRPGLEPDEAQDRQMRNLWLGPFLGPHVIAECEKIMNQKVTRAQLSYRYGPRNGSPPAKRDVMGTGRHKEFSDG